MDCNDFLYIYGGWMIWHYRYYKKLRLVGLWWGEIYCFQFHSWLCSCYIFHAILCSCYVFHSRLCSCYCSCYFHSILCSCNFIPDYVHVLAEIEQLSKFRERICWILWNDYGKVSTKIWRTFRPTSFKEELLSWAFCKSCFIWLMLLL